MISFKSPKKIRIFSPDFPLPIRAGADHVIAHQWLGLLELGHDVELVCWRESQESLARKWSEFIQSVPRTLKAPTSNFETLKFQLLRGYINLQESPFQRGLRVAAALVHGDASPEWVYYPPTSALLDEWKRLSTQSPVDLEIYHYSFAHTWLASKTGKSLRAHSQATRVVHSHNLESTLAAGRRAPTLAKLLPNSVHQLNAARLFKHEHALSHPNLADELWFLGRADLNLFESNVGQKADQAAIPLRLVPPTLSTPLAPKQKASKKDSLLTLGIVGNFDFGPNQQSLNWILEEVLPLLEETARPTQLLIAGKITNTEKISTAQSALRSCDSNLDINVLGFVDDIDREFWDKVDLFLAPDLSGSGVRIKLLDALQRQIPTLTHPKSLERLPANLTTRPAKILRAGSTAKEWSDTILSYTLPTGDSDDSSIRDALSPSTIYGALPALNGRSKTIFAFVVDYNAPHDSEKLCLQLANERNSTGLISDIKLRVVHIDNGNLIARSLSPAQQAADVQLLRLPENHGYGAGLDGAIRQVDPDGQALAYWLLNCDLELKKGCLAPLIQSLLSSPHTGAVGPKVIKGNAQAPNPTAQKVWGTRGVISPWLGLTAMTDWDLHSPLPHWSYIPGSSLLIRAQAYHQVGGLNLKYGMYFEETELCLKMQKQGWALRVAPNSVVFHAVQSLASGVPSRTFCYYFVRNQIYFWRANFRIPTLIQLPRTVFSTLKEIVLPLRKCKDISTLRDRLRLVHYGLMDGLRLSRDPDCALLKQRAARLFTN